jgi:hypothetical protein
MPGKAEASPPKQGGMGGRGTLTGGVGGDAVSGDLLWRHRIAQELQYLRTWRDEYRWLQDQKQRFAAADASNTNSPNAATKGSSADASPTRSEGSNSVERSAERSPASSAAITRTLLDRSTAVGTAAATVDIETLMPSDLLHLQRELSRGQYQSTARASYTLPGKQLELPDVSHRKLKFKY